MLSLTGHNHEVTLVIAEGGLCGAVDTKLPAKIDQLYPDRRGAVFPMVSITRQVLDLAKSNRYQKANPGAAAAANFDT